MSLQTRLADLATAIGVDIKALQDRVFLRTSANKSSSSLAANASEDLTWVLHPSFRAYKVDANRAARIRIYATAAQRTDDAGRAIGTDPVGNHGLLFELVTSAEILSYTLSPAVDFTADSEATYYMSVTNLSGATGVVTTTFYYVRTE